MNASSKKKLAQYERLAGTLRDRIAAGIYARGDKLPSEMELMDESGLSRSTVRHALKVLVDEGLVRTERGRGAFVADTPALHENNLVFSSYTTQVQGQGMKPTTRTVDSGFAKARQCGQVLRCRRGQQARQTCPTALSGRCAAVPGDHLSTTEL
ncbi:MAG: GntR family transcriptional regulator [Collinsella sp.]